MDKGIEKAVLGIRYLIKYAKNSNEAYFPIIKDCAKEIRLWCLLTLFSNNMDGLGENVTDTLLDDFFCLNPIETDQGIIDYGRGYHSKSTLPHKEEFKRIRDKLCHMDFTYHDDMIYLGDEEETYFDILWLEKLILTSIANFRNTLQKGMSDITTLSFLPNHKDINLDFEVFWKLGLIQLYKLTILNGNKNTWESTFWKTGIKAERFTFDLIYAAVKRDLNSKRLNLNVPLEELLEQLNSLFAKIEEKYHHYLKLEIVSPEEYAWILNEKGFSSLSFKGKQQYLANKLELGDGHFYNSIITHNIVDILKHLREDKIDYDELYILRDAEAFLLKVYANILFSCVYVNQDSLWELKNSLHNDFVFTTRFVYAANVYKEYLKVLNRAYREAEEHQAGKEYQTYLGGFIHYYTKLYEEALNGEVDKRLFWNIRNAIIHDQVEFNDREVRLYTTGRNIVLKHFQKKKQAWVDKEIQNKRIIWEMVIDKEEFLKMMDKLFGLKNISVQMNISKYVRRKKE